MLIIVPCHIKAVMSRAPRHLLSPCTKLHQGMKQRSLTYCNPKQLSPNHLSSPKKSLHIKRKRCKKSKDVKDKKAGVPTS